MSSLEAEEIYRSMMLISAIRSPVKIAAKIQNVICTEEPGMSDIAADVGMRSWMTHGWRPTSATIHPA